MIQKISSKTIQMDKKQPSNPHDRFFKQAYSNLEFVVEIFKLIFSKKEFHSCKWKSLKIEKDTLKEDKRADLIFSVPLKNNPDTCLKIFILLEHKSKYDQKLFTQLLTYQTLIHEQTLKQYGQAQPIVPVLFYHGRRPWKWKTSFQAIYFDKIPAFFRKNMLNYELRVLDVHSPKVTKVLKDKRFKSRGVLNLFRRIWSLKMNEKELTEVLSKFGRLKDEDLVLGLISYFRAFGMSKKIWNKVERNANQQNILQKGEYMGIREELREEGRMEGRQEGRQERNKQVILNMLKKQMDIDIISEVTGLSEKEIQKLKKNNS